MPRSTTRSSRVQSTTTDHDAIIAAAVQAALAAVQGQAQPASKPRTTKAQTKAQTYDLTKAATRSQVFRAFFAMAKAHHGLTFGAGDWPTSGDIQAILDSLK